MVRLGILGGGQLAQMMTQAAVSLGVETAIFERKPDSPAARLTAHQIAGDWTDTAKIRQFAEMCDVVTLENEFVDAHVLEQLEALGVPVFPGPAMLATVQDKLTQKQAVEKVGVPVPAFRQVESAADVLAAAEDFGWPLLLKARRDGYDGYGNATLKSPDDVEAAWARLGANGRKLMVEAWVPFTHELAVMVLRGRDGAVLAYPLVETVQQNHVCHVVRAPAVVDDAIGKKAQEIAIAAVEAVDGVGVVGVELFLLADGSILYNEMAPRPHNSGHYTIEACTTSQFENHIRAVLGWPLGAVEMVKPAAVMVNLLGEREGDANFMAVAAAVAVPDAHVHFYGKRQVRRGRKMGHVTVIGENVAECEAAARRAVEAMQV